MTQPPFATRVKLMPEHVSMLPLWDSSPSNDKWYGPIERGALGISAELEERLYAWNELYQSLAGPNFDGPSPEQGLDFDVAGHFLAAELQRELGDRALVLYVDEDERRSAPLVLPRPADADVKMFTSSPNGWLAVGPDGQQFRPDAQPRLSIIEQMQAMPDAAFAELMHGFDSSLHQWSPGRRPTRVLLELQLAQQPATPPEAQLDWAPLRDRSPLLNRPDSLLSATSLGISRDLANRLREWGTERPLDSAQPVDRLIAGHELAGELKRELGPDVSVLFPEASPSRSEPSLEMRAVIERLAAASGPAQSELG